MIQFVHANHSNTNRVITIRIHSDKTLFQNVFVTLLRSVAKDLTSLLLSLLKSYDFNAANFRRFSWHQNFDIIMDACEVPGNGPRKRMSNSTLFPNGLSRLVMWLNAESDDWNILSTPDPSQFFVTLMLSMNFPVSIRILLKFLPTKLPTTIPLFARNTMSTSWSRNLDSIHFQGILHTIWPIFLHHKCLTTTNRSSLPSEYRQIMRSSICLTFIGFQRCTKST